ncbi:MAG: EAL domain-containing protein [Pseudomonadota bacterium]
MTKDNNKQMDIIQLEKQLHDREAEIELLKVTFSEIGSELDLEKVFHIVAKQARELISAETVLVPILDEECEIYTYRGGAGKNSDEIVGESLPRNFGICGWVWEHKRAWWRGVLEELDDKERNLWEKEAGTVILVPLIGRKHFLGGIAGFNKQGNIEFDRRDLNLLSIFASTVAIVIENAMTFQKLEASNQTMLDYQQRLNKLNKQLTESSRELEYLTLYDPLTSLPNRSLFNDRMMQYMAIANKHKQTIGLLLINLNNFKEINDTLGHENADLILNHIAKRFSKHLLANETLGRLGGDEFVLILPEKDQHNIVKRGVQLLNLLDQAFTISDTETSVSASIGASVYPQHGEDISTLLSHTSAAMNYAKNNKLGIHLYNPEENLTSFGQLTMTTELHKALDENCFELYYQPKINLENEKLLSVEALGRWNHSKHGFIPPGVFIEALEQSGLIDRYTQWAIETSIKQIHNWKESGYDITIAVNISTQTLNHTDFINYLNIIIPDSNCGSFLIFEITENLFLSEFDHLSETLQLIRKLGITFSIDDFGTGYSSLSRLKKLPVSELKIDSSFVLDMINNQEDDVIVKSTIDLAHNLDLKVVAEGVEDKKTYERLKQLNCDTIQGYYISKPVPINLFNEFLSNRK